MSILNQLPWDVFIKWRRVVLAANEYIPIPLDDSRKGWQKIPSGVAVTRNRVSVWRKPRESVKVAS